MSRQLPLPSRLLSVSVVIRLTLSFPPRELQVTVGSMQKTISQLKSEVGRYLLAEVLGGDKH